MMKNIVLFSLVSVITTVQAAPTNEQLYEMILGLKNEIADSKGRESDLHVELNKTKTDLNIAKKQLSELPNTGQGVSTIKHLKNSENDIRPTQADSKEGFTITAGALYVKPVTSANTPYPYDYIDNNNINYGPGFQVSADYQAKNNWDYALQFKHFQSTSNVSNDTNYYYQGGIPNIEYAINYNVLDLEIGKLFTFSDTVSLRISGGLRSAIMNEKLTSTSSISSSSSGSYSSYPDWIYTPYTITTNSNISDSMSNNFWGIGPRITGEPGWKPFGNNFRIFGSVAGSFLMGQQNDTYSGASSYNCSSTSTVVTCGSNSTYAYKNDYRRESFVTMLEAGSGMGYTIKTKSMAIDLKTGYQLEHWIVTDQTDNLMFRGFHGAYGIVGVNF
jgi:hypothetical protein